MVLGSECVGMDKYVCVVCECAYEHVYVCINLSVCCIYVCEYALCLSVCCVYVVCCVFVSFVHLSVLWVCVVCVGVL